MKEYLLTLTGVMVVSGAIGMLSAEGNLKKYVRLLCALCLLCALASPLFSFLSQEEFDPSALWESIQPEKEEEYDEIYQDSLLKNGESYVEDALKNKISEKFSLDPDTFDVVAKIAMKNDTYALSSIGVVLKGEAIFADPKRIAAYVNELANCPCTVVYD